MTPRVSLRKRLLAVAALGALVCVVASAVVLKMLSMTAEQRLGRARDAVSQELETVGDARTSATLATTYVGLRGGVVQRGETADVDPPIKDALDAVVARAAATNDRATGTTTIGDITILVAARPMGAGRVAWAAYTVNPPTLLWGFRLTLVLMLATAALVVAASISTVVGVRRGAGALNDSLDALAKDLHAPLSRPSIPELAEVSQGIAKLAAALAKAEEEQRRLSRELADRERLASLGRVVAGVAHEVRNPLASIKLRLDLAATSSATPPDLAAEIERTTEEISRLDRLVADLLVVAGRRLGPLVPTDLASLAKHRADLLSAWAHERGVDLEVRGAAKADVDPDAMARVLDNLLRNAVEASPRGAKVSVEIDKGARGVTIAVLDRGVGVDDDRAAELFEPFFTTKPGGTGLGLAQSRAILAAHGGSVAYRRQGAVTRFELALPLQKIAAATEAA